MSVTQKSVPKTNERTIISEKKLLELQAKRASTK